MKITMLGIIMALKNIGSWLASYTLAGMTANPAEFYFALVCYILITVPTDLFMLNHIQNNAKLEAKRQ